MSNDSKLLSEKRFGNSYYVPKKPSPRPPLRMLSPPDLTKGSSVSPRTPPLEAESEADISDPESDVSLDADRCYPANELSGISKRTDRTSRSPCRTSDRIANNGSASPKSRQPSQKNTLQDGGPRISKACRICVTGAVVVAATLILHYSSAMNVHNRESPEDRDRSSFEALSKLGHNIDGIRRKFKDQSSYIWRDLEAGIADVIRNPQRPTIFLLFSSDEDSMSCLAKMIGNASKTALGSEEDLRLSPKHFGESYGAALDTLKAKIERQKVVIVENFLDIHPEAIKSFHNLCDRENPLVKEAIYILTMVVDDYWNESIMEFVEKHLTLKLQEKVNDEKLQPLITRITAGAIIHVKPEPYVKTCPLRY